MEKVDLGFLFVFGFLTLLKSLIDSFGFCDAVSTRSLKCI